MRSDFFYRLHPQEPYNSRNIREIASTFVTLFVPESTTTVTADVTSAESPIASRMAMTKEMEGQLDALAGSFEDRPGAWTSLSRDSLSMLMAYCMET